jgi:hypothetical protein
MVNAPIFEITWPPDLKFSGNHNAVLSAKLDQLRLDGNLHNPASFALAADVVNACDEFTKRPGLFRGISFHELKRRLEDRIDVMGCLPHRSECARTVFLCFQV